MPSPINASAPRTASTQAPRRTTLIELSPGKYTFEHAGVFYDVRVNQPPTDKADPMLHRRLQTLLRIFISQATADLGKPPKDLRVTSNGCQVNGRDFQSSQPARLKHYLTVVGQLFGDASEILAGRRNVRQKLT